MSLMYGDGLYSFSPPEPESELDRILKLIDDEQFLQKIMCIVEEGLKPTIYAYP